MKIAVTAATGRLGQAVITELLARLPNSDVIAIARDPAQVPFESVATRAGDYAQVEQMQKAFAGVDTGVFISAPVTAGVDRLALHQNVVIAAKRAGVRKLIYTSVIGNELAADTYFAPFYELNAGTEKLVKESGLEWVIARNGLYLDLDLVHIRKADAAGGVYRNNAGEGRCGYISIAELGYAIAGLATSDDCNGMCVNLFGELYTQAELVAFANEAYGLHVRYEPITLQQNVERFLQDERIAARGAAVARMLSGCFECMSRGAYEGASHFERAAGRPAKSIPQQLAELDIP